MKREYKNILSKLEIREMCIDEIFEIVKENVKDEDEVRIDSDFGISLKDACDPIIYDITSIGCKVEDREVAITLYCNEGRKSAIDWDIEDCDD